MLLFVMNKNYLKLEWSFTVDHLLVQYVAAENDCSR